MNQLPEYMNVKRKTLVKLNMHITQVFQGVGRVPLTKNILLPIFLGLNYFYLLVKKTTTNFF